MADPETEETPAEPVAELPEVAEGETPPVDSPYFRAFVRRQKPTPPDPS